MRRFCFSSRRRHTRWPRDWSSDVCSSDLKMKELVKQAKMVIIVTHSLRYAQRNCDRLMWLDQGKVREIGDPNTIIANRSEERRVGKECSARRQEGHRTRRTCNRRATAQQR